MLSFVLVLILIRPQRLCCRNRQDLPPIQSLGKSRRLLQRLLLHLEQH